jgi:hypothetical protein
LKKKALAPLVMSIPAVTAATHRIDQGTKNRVRLVMTVTPTRASTGDRLGEGRRPGKRRGHIAEVVLRVKGVSATTAKD